MITKNFLIYMFINVNVLIINIVYANSQSKTYFAKFSNTFTWTEGFRKCKAYDGSITSRKDLELAVSKCRNIIFEESVWINDIMPTTQALQIIGCFEVGKLNARQTVNSTSVATVYTLCNCSCFAISNTYSYCLQTCKNIPIDKRANLSFCHATNVSLEYAAVYGIVSDSKVPETDDKRFKEEQYLILECVSSIGQNKIIPKWWNLSMLGEIQPMTACVSDEQPYNITILDSFHRCWSSALDACIRVMSHMVTHNFNDSTLCGNLSREFTYSRTIWTGTRTYQDIIFQEDKENQNLSFCIESRKECTHMSPTKLQELKTSCEDVKHGLICISGSEIDAKGIEESCSFPEDNKSQDYFSVLVITLIILSIIGCASTLLWRRRLHCKLKDRDNNQVEGSMNQHEHQNTLENNELSRRSTDSYSTDGEELPTYNHTATYIAKQENS